MMLSDPHPHAAGAHPRSGRWDRVLLIGLLAVTALGLIATWCMAAFSLPQLRALVARNRTVLIGGVVVGIVAWQIGNTIRFLWYPLRDSTFWASQHLLQLLVDDLQVNATEMLLGRPAYLALLRAQAVDYVMVDPTWAGGSSRRRQSRGRPGPRRTRPPAPPGP